MKRQFLGMVVGLALAISPQPLLSQRCGAGAGIARAAQVVSYTVSPEVSSFPPCGPLQGEAIQREAETSFVGLVGRSLAGPLGRCAFPDPSRLPFFFPCQPHCGHAAQRLQPGVLQCGLWPCGQQALRGIPRPYLAGVRFHTVVLLHCRHRHVAGGGCPHASSRFLALCRRDSPRRQHGRGLRRVPQC